MSEKAQLFEKLYAELRSLAGRRMRTERSGHTLQPTALVHELWIQLDGQTRASWKNEAHFRATAAQLMSRLLAEHARSKRAEKRGGDMTRVTLDGDLALAEPDADVDALHDAMEELRAIDADVAAVVDYCFVGLTQPEMAELLGVSERKVRADWAWARAWLRSKLEESGPHER